jgi:Fe-S cluster assembly protein SufB
MFNLNTKRAIVEEGGLMEWVTGSFGSKVSMLYPMTILNGTNAREEFTGISFAGKGQVLDTGAKVILNAPNTSAVINAKSISKDGGNSITRTLIKITEKAEGAKAYSSCKSLIVDKESKADAIPILKVANKDSEAAHEASVGKISEEAVFYLKSRGISDEEARSMIVRGFVSEVSKELPVEYAMEMNELIKLEMEGLA